MKFEFVSPLYRNFLWGVLAVFLTSDILFLFSLWNGASGQTNAVSLVFFLVGFLLRGSIVYCLTSKEGPIVQLLFFFGALLILTGIAGFLTLWLSKGTHPIKLYFDYTYSLAVGMALAYPAHECIEFSYANEDSEDATPHEAI